MTRNIRIVFAFLLLCAFASAQQEKPLGDIARAARKSKPTGTGKVYTNDDLTGKDTPAAAPAQPDQPAAADAAAPKEANPDDAKKAEAEWAGKLDAAKKDVAQLQRELDVAERDYKTRLSGKYFDRGQQLRDEKKWAEDERKSVEEIDAKKKQLEAAKQKLEEMREAARKAGMPPRLISD